MSNSKQQVERPSSLSLCFVFFASQTRATFASLAALPNVEVVVRTGYPGQVQCINYTAPFENVECELSLVQSTRRPKKLTCFSSPCFILSPPPVAANTTLFGWDRIAMINMILRENMGVLYPTPSLLLDVERQGTLRGDARLKPSEKGGDCLHMCQTANRRAGQSGWRWR